MGTKKVGYNKSGIDKLPDDKPVLYRIKTQTGKDNYVGVAKRGRVQDYGVSSTRRKRWCGWPDRRSSDPYCRPR